MVRGKGLGDRRRILGGGNGKLRAAFRSRIRLSGAAKHQSWIDEIAEAYPDEGWITDDNAPEDEDFDPRPWHDFYFRAFDAIRFDRQFGALGGESPISYLVMSQYARDYGLQLDEFERFRRFIGVLDAVHLELQAEQAKLTKEQSP
jgi:hypothetical protein